MTDLRKQVFQAIEQLAFHYQGDKADLEKLIDVVVELIQKREAEAELTGFNYAINKCTSLIGKESYGEEANQAIRFLAQAWALDLPMVSSQLKNDTLNLPDGQIPVVKPNVKTDVPKVMAILKNEGKVKDE